MPSSSSEPLPPSRRPRRPWRIVGALILTDVALTFLGAGIDHGAPELGADRQQVLDSFVGVGLTARLLGGYLEFAATLVFLAWALLVGRLLRADGVLAGWLSSAIAAAAVLVGALTLGSVAVEIAAGYDGQQGAAAELLGVLNDGADVAYFGALGIRGLFLVCVAVAGLTTRSLPAGLCWIGVAVGIVGFGSPLGAAAGLHQLAYLAGVGWTVALAVIALSGRPARRATPAPDAPARSIAG